MRTSSALAIGLLAAAVALSAQSASEISDSSQSALVVRARQVVSGMLVRLPNYTCLETLDRAQRSPRDKEFHSLDRVRVEVAFVNGEEYYAWPGSPKIEETDLFKMISGQGASGTGDFGKYLRVTYKDDKPLHLVGKERLNDKEAWKFTQDVPVTSSKFDVVVHPARATVAYQVTTWHDVANMDLLRFELVATEIPRELHLRRTFKATEYETVSVNGVPIRLPSRTELSMTTRSGLENYTVSTFSNCHEYKGESKLIFDEPAKGETAPPAVLLAPPPAVDLPAGLQVHVSLDREVDLKNVARGDAVTMTVLRDAFRNRQKVLSTGARIKGRWKLAECRNVPVSYCFAILETEAYEDSGASGRFQALLESPSVEREMTLGGRSYSNGRGMYIPEGILHAEQGAAILYAGMGTKLPRGYRLIWRTLEVSGVTKP